MNRKQRRFVRGASTPDFTPDDVLRTLANPVYAGIGPFSPIVAESQWVACWVLSAHERPISELLAIAWENVNYSFGEHPNMPARAGWIEAQSARMVGDDESIRLATWAMLSDLRRTLGGSPQAEA